MGVIPSTGNHKAAGKLQGHLDTWKVITRDPWVVNTIKGYQIDFLSKPYQRVIPHTPQYSVEQNQLIEAEVKELLGKEAIIEVHNPRGGFLFQPVPGPKEGWRSETSDKPKSPEQLCSDSALQNGGNPYIEGLSQSKGLVSQGGSEGCVFCNPNPPVSPPVPEVQVPGEMLSVPMPPIWPVISSLSLYQDPEASTGSPSGDGGTTDSVHRRYPHPGGVQRGVMQRV